MTEPLVGSRDNKDRLVLELCGVTKTYGSFMAVKKIDLQLERGRVLGFLGPNGAGKTTTLKLMTGLLRPTAGTIRVCGFDLRRSPLAAKMRLAFISDKPFLYEKLTGAEFLRFIGGLWGMGAKDIAQGTAHWLARFDLTGWEGEPVEAYSHGMRQRLLLCAALLHRPELLIMDEPTVGLDPSGTVQLKRIMRELAVEQKLAVVLSTHTLEVVEQICDEVVIIHHGQVVAAGTLAELRQSRGGSSDGALEQIFLELTSDPAASQGQVSGPGEDDPA